MVWSIIQSITDILLCKIVDKHFRAAYWSLFNLAVDRYLKVSKCICRVEDKLNKQEFKDLHLKLRLG